MTSKTCSSAGAPVMKMRLPAFIPAILKPALGIAGLILLWKLGAEYLVQVKGLRFLENIAPEKTALSFLEIIADEKALANVWESLSRIFQALFLSSLLGGCGGILFGHSKVFRESANLPFQFLRMVSPLAWMPLAVAVYPTWEGAIIFLLVASSVWPVLFSVANGVRRIDSGWLLVADSFKANFWRRLAQVIIPAVMRDFFSGIRLGLGVCWIVIVPAEFLGVTSGLGYALNDARDSLDYGRLMALIVLIGLLGYLMDAALGRLAKKFQWEN